jgi:NAD(P)-dependent dehydrogenase (short-subunit alcohol dehydrogenase family)
MQNKRVALITGANQGVGLHVATELVAKGLTVLVGARNFERGEAAANIIGPGAVAVQIDVTNQASIAAAASASARSLAASTCSSIMRPSRIRGRAICHSRTTQK